MTPAQSVFCTSSLLGTTIAGRAGPASDRVAGSLDARPKQNLLPMKLFFAMVLVGLLSMLSGLFMAYR